MKRLNWDELYCVSNHRMLADNGFLDGLRQQCAALPEGYADFVTTFGFGTWDSIQVLSPSEIREATPMLQETLQMWGEDAEEFEHPLVIPESSVEDAIPLATSAWGEYFFCSPSDPGTLWYLDRPHDWDDSTTFLPLGFHNLFLHQAEDGSTFNRSEVAMVFHPSRPIETLHLLLTNHAEGISNEESIQTVVNALSASREITHRLTSHDVHFLYIQPLGAEVRVAHSPRHDCPFVFAVVDANQSSELESIQASIVEAGFEIREPD